MLVVSVLNVIMMMAVIPQRSLCNNNRTHHSVRIHRN